MYVELYKELIIPFFFLNFTKCLCKLLTETTELQCNFERATIYFFKAALNPLQDMSDQERCVRLIYVCHVLYYK